MVSFWPVVIVVTVPAAPHVTAFGSPVSMARKQRYAPFFPPEKLIFPPATRVVGLAVTSTSAPDGTVMAWLFVSELGGLSLTAMQCRQLIFPIEEFVHVRKSGLEPHLACFFVHWSASFCPVVIVGCVSVDAAGALHVTAFGSPVSTARKQSQAPFIPPVKPIEPPGTKLVGDALTEISPEAVGDRVKSLPAVDALAESELDVQWIQLK